MRAGLTVQQIEYLCAGREVEVLERCAGIPAEVLDGKNHPCPLCGGKDRFRLINPKEGTVFCNQCFSEKNHGFISAVMHFQGLKFPEALRRVAEEFNGYSMMETSGRNSASPKADPKKVSDLKYEFATTFVPVFDPSGSPKAMKKSCSAVGRKPWGMDLLWNGYSYVNPGPARPGAKVIRHTVYEYTNGDGSPNYMVYRMDFRDGKKIPAVFHWNGKVYVSGKAESALLVPWNAERVKEAETIYIVEGEKCAVALQWHLDKNAKPGEDVPAVTCFLGGASQRLDAYAVWFQGKHLRIYPDNDDAGRKYARNLCELLAASAASLKVYRWPDGTPEKWDIADEVRKRAEDEKCA